MASKKNITAEFLRQIFAYDENLGTLTWRFRSPDTFKSDHYRTAKSKCNRWNKMYAGKPAGSVCKGYLRVRVKGLRIKTHHIIWFLETGRWPTEIDHRDGVRYHNIFGNLREASSAENAQNRQRRIDNQSGYTGVYLSSKGEWKAEIGFGGKSICLGIFKTKLDARDAYLVAKAKHHLFQPSPRADG